MSTNSAIEWTDATWNPVRGCTKVSPGCANCYAETFAERFRGVKNHPYEQGFDLRLVPEKLAEPLSWKKPRRTFVNSMSDLFQDGVPDEYIDRVFAVMALSPWHTYQVLTKRAERMQAYCSALTFERVRHWMNLSPDGHELKQPTQACGFVPNGKENLATIARRTKESIYRFDPLAMPMRTPPPPFLNVWLGVSVENQRFADKRIPLLLQTPAAMRFISAEPLLGALDLQPFLQYEPFHEHYKFTADECEWRGLDWIIVGGESGPGARPFDVAWARSIVEQCKAAGVAVFVKQLGARAFDSTVDLNAVNYHTHAVGAMNRLIYLRLGSRKGGDPGEWPADLRIREFPRVEVPA